MYNILVDHDIKSITRREIVRKLESGKHIICNTYIL